MHGRTHAFTGDAAEGSRAVERTLARPDDRMPRRPDWTGPRSPQTAVTDHMRARTVEYGAQSEPTLPDTCIIKASVYCLFSRMADKMVKHVSQPLGVRVLGG